VDRRPKSGNAFWKGSGKEELRASVLKPYLLRMRAEKGEKAVKALLATTGLPGAVLENETAWISVAAARRGLAALEAALGREALRRRGEWAVHPESLGTYVRLLRGASSPQDAYRQLCEHVQETTRVGTMSAEPLGPTGVKVVYTPIEGDDPPELDPLLSLAREAELASIPRLWGLDEAEVKHETSTGSGARESVYELRWRTPHNPAWIPGAAALGLVVAGLPAFLLGTWAAGLVVGVLGGVLGGALGALHGRVQRERVARAFEQNRIAALERGLQLRGDLPGEEAPLPGELDGVVLGGKYKILKKIGSGGIGVVYSAQHLTLGGQVAVKVLRGAAAKDASEIARLRREAQVQSNIEHPNVVRTLDLDQMPDGSIYVVMELLRGINLADRLSREGPLAPGLAIPLFRDVCKALAAAHSKGVVHRDLKPGNIFLCEGGEAKVLDFGMSKLHSAETLTQEGYTLGTPEYMAPEQCIGANVEPRTDLYAFGVLMYEALTGELPIQAKNRRDLLDLHQQQIPQPIRVCRPDLPIPPELDEAIMMCLRKRNAERPRDARELDRMLGAVPLEGLPTAYPRGIHRRRSR
jgi:serine/threonine-protein kinase